jgi:cytoskeletal protein RodZ
LHLGQPPRTTSRIDPRSRKRLALFVALALCLFAFVLAAGEAWAAEQPSKTTQPGTVESTKTINGKIAELVPGAKPPPVVTPPVGPPPVEKPAAEDPAPLPPKNETQPSKKTSSLPPRNETQPSKETSPLPPRNETQPVEENSPPPIDPAPSTPEPEVSAPQPAPRPAPQWFAVKTDGEALESAPVLTYHSASDFGRVLAPKPMPNDSPDAAVVIEGVTWPPSNLLSFRERFF